MEKTSQKIRIISNSEEQFIHPSELLLPLNSFVNLINFLENLESQFKDYEGSMKKRNQSVDFHRFIESRLLRTRHHIHSFQENDCVMIEAMSKKSPYWVDLLITASPYVIQVIQTIITDNANGIENEIIKLLEVIPSFQEMTELEKQKIAKRLVKNFNWLLSIIHLIIRKNDD